MEIKSTESIYELIQREWEILLTLFLAGILFYIYPICHQAITFGIDRGSFIPYLRVNVGGLF
jgi:hypothetical protein